MRTSSCISTKLSEVLEADACLSSTGNVSALVDLRAANCGTSLDDAALSCKAILHSCAATEDGVYYISKSDGSAAQTYCRMSNGNGGWTLAGHMSRTACVASRLPRTSSETD